MNLEEIHLHKQRCHYPEIGSVLRFNTRRGKSAGEKPEAIKKNSMVSVRERTIPTERPPLVGEVSANF
jgi:hypothetical protein